MTRIRLLGLIALFFLGQAPGANATTFKIATLSPEGSFWLTTMKAAASRIARETDNRVKFRFYPGGVMGNDQAVLKKIRIGQLQGAALPSGALAGKAPDTQVYNIPLLFRSYAEVDYVRQRLDGEIEQAVADAGFMSFGFAEGGFAYVMSKQRISVADELKSSKVWVLGDDLASQAAAESFGIAPVSLSLGDVLTGLQTGLIDTVAVSPIGAIALQWHTQVRYVLDLPIVYIYALLAIDQKAFAKLTPPDQQVVERVMRATFREMGVQNRKDNQGAFSALANQGIETVLPGDEQLQDWKNRAGAAATVFTRSSGISPGMLDRVEKLLAEYRAGN